MNFEGTPYAIEPAAAEGVVARIAQLNDRVEALRTIGKLSEETLRAYYGEKRFEQIAESNALEGSTLSVGETELAVLKGITITGHDPQYVRDAVTLAKALDRLVDLAREHRATDIAAVKELNELILGDRPSAGQFRNNTPVRIKGQPHVPPETWREIMDQMEQLERWSRTMIDAPPVFRATLLHAWLTHVHPFGDGNGRTARAVTNLELIRSGYPPIIIRKNRDRSRYITALAESAVGGDLSQLFDLISDRLEDAIRDLERAAKRGDAYDPVVVRVRKAQGARLGIWNAAVDLLIQQLRADLEPRLAPVNGALELERFVDALPLDDFVALCERRASGNSWAFRLRVAVPALAAYERLAWTGYRSDAMVSRLPNGVADGPSLFWSARNPGRYPPWIRSTHDAPGMEEATFVDDTWHALEAGRITRLAPSRLADRVAKAVLSALT